MLSTLSATGVALLVRPLVVGVVLELVRIAATGPLQGYRCLVHVADSFILRDFAVGAAVDLK